MVHPKNESFLVTDDIGIICPMKVGKNQKQNNEETAK